MEEWSTISSSMYAVVKVALRNIINGVIWVIADTMPARILVVITSSVNHTRYRIIL